jgi:GDP-4-dehydro-6-deoxy-D-mannose reductase
MTRALVTGATGFVGRHLVALLQAQGVEVVALGLPDDPLRGVLPADMPFWGVDVRDTAVFTSILQQTNPDYLFHLAGLVRGRDLARLLDINVQGTETVLSATSQLPNPPRVVIPGSAAEYGLLRDDQPVTEQSPTQPLGAYGVSKVAQTLTGLGYAWRGQLEVVVGRVFNITGPGEPDLMLCGAMAAQIAAIERGEQPPVLSVGNLSPTRDYVDVRDMVQALWLLSQRGQSGEIYNIASGEAVVVETVVRQLASLARVAITLEPDPARQRPADVPHMVGSSAKLHAATGWQISHPLGQSLQDTLDWWRRVDERGLLTPLTA